MASLGATFRRTRDEVRNWYTVGLLASVVMPTRIPPRRGMAGTWLGRRVVTFYLRDGSAVKCRLQDAGDLVSVYVERDYATFPIPWPTLRTIVDAGATTGCFTLWAHQKAPNARILAIEPNRTVFPFLVENVRANRLSEQVETMPVALGARAGFADVVDPSYSTFATAIARSVASTSTVDMTTLEHVLDEARFSSCDLLKIDIEGGEYDVLLVADASTLARIRTIVCEFHPMPNHSVNELVRHLTDNGFRVSVSGGLLGFIFAER